MDIWKELKQEGVDSGLLEEVRAFRDAHPAPPEAAGRVPRPRFLYYGKEVWEGAAAAGHVDEFFFSRPSLLWAEFRDMVASGTLARHLATTGQEAGLGLLFGGVLYLAALNAQGVHLRELFRLQ